MENKIKRFRDILFPFKAKKLSNSELNLAYSNKYKILHTKKINCSGADFEIHMLLCRKDFYNAFWCLKSFYFFSSFAPFLVIHDDGSLTTKQKSLLKSHFKGIRLIAKVNSDIKLKKQLKNYPNCSKFRFNNKTKLAIKIFGPYSFSRSDTIMVIDSDILFFRKPTEMEKMIDDNIFFFLSDYQDAYSIPFNKIRSRFGLQVPNKFNSGLIYFPKVILDISFIEEVLSYLNNYKNQKQSWIEQTIYSLLFSRFVSNAERLGNNYQISFQRITKDTICHHFVNNGSRLNFYAEGISKLKSSNFLKLFSMQ